MAEANTKEPLTPNDIFCKYIVDEFDRYKRFWGGKHEKCRKYLQYWEGRPPNRNWDWQNQVPVPVMVEGEQTITPRLFTALFPNEAPIDVKVEGSEDPQQGIKIKYLLQHYFKVSDVQSAFAAALTQCTLFGTAYLEGGSWYVKKGWQIGDDGVRYESIIESRPDCRPVDFFEIFPHPAKLRMDDGLPLIRKRMCDAGYLRSLMDNPFFETKNIAAALNTDFPDLHALDPQAKKGEYYELLEYWGPKDNDIIDPTSGKRISTQKAVPWWGIVVNRKVLIRSIANPYNHQIPPFLKIKLYQDAKPNWYGVGIGQIGAPTQERLNKMVNQRLDNVDLVLNRQGVYNGNDPLVDKKRLAVSKPGKFYRCSDTLTSIKFLDVPDVTASSYKEEELTKQYFREATGASDALMPSGDVADQHRTAMGIQLMQGAAGARFKPVLRCMEMDGIQQLAMFYFSNLKQFMTNDEWILITGDNGTTQPIQVSPEDIQAKVFFIPMGVSETVNKEMQLGQLMRYKELTMDDPTVNRQEINRRVAELFGFKDVQKLLTPINMGAENGLLTGQNKLKIQQRLAEGATPEQIKEELMGPPPIQNGPQALQQLQQQPQGGPAK